jgi:uncharacterized protein (TIGR02001 family)
MKKLNVLALSAAIAAASLTTTGTAVAGVTANVGAASNYLWRGVSLSREAAAVSGGVDYSHDSGLYAGVWVSSEGAAAILGATGTPTGETDVYVGYAGEYEDVSYDIGYLSYMYPQSESVNDSDFDEITLSVGYEFAEFLYANSSDLDSDYMALTLSHDRYSFTYGDYSFDDSASDYSHFDLSAALTDELSLTYSQNDITGDDDGRLVIAYGLEFDVK